MSFGVEQESVTVQTFNFTYTSPTSVDVNFSHNCGGGNRFLTIGVHYNGGSNPDTVEASFDGNLLTLNQQVGAGVQWFELYSLVAPPTGVLNGYVRFGSLGGTVVYTGALIIRSFKGVIQDASALSNPLSTTGSAAFPPQISYPALRVGSLVVDSMSVQNTTGIAYLRHAGPNQVQRVAQSSGGTNILNVYSSDERVLQVGNVLMNWLPGVDSLYGTTWRLSAWEMFGLQSTRGSGTAITSLVKGDI